MRTNMSRCHTAVQQHMLCMQFNLQYFQLKVFQAVHQQKIVLKILRNCYFITGKMTGGLIHSFVLFFSKRYRNTISFENNSNNHFTLKTAQTSLSSFSRAHNFFLATSCSCRLRFCAERLLTENEREIASRKREREEIKWEKMIHLNFSYFHHFEQIRTLECSSLEGPFKKNYNCSYSCITINSTTLVLNDAREHKQESYPPLELLKKKKFGWHPAKRQFLKIMKVTV